VEDPAVGKSGEEADARRGRDTARADALRLAAAVAVVALLVVAGLQVATDPPGDRVLHGRTGEIHTHSR
jgi:hypothetical protein